jgi:hypothetical protein
VLKEIEKAQAKNQSDYQKKRAKVQVLNKNKNYLGKEITSLSVGDMVTISPRGRAPKVSKDPEIFKVFKLGKDKTPSQGKVEISDNSVPPQSWWEATTNVGIFARVDEFPHMN